MNINIHEIKEDAHLTPRDVYILDCRLKQGKSFREAAEESVPNLGHHVTQNRWQQVYLSSLRKIQWYLRSYVDMDYTIPWLPWQSTTNGYEILFKDLKDNPSKLRSTEGGVNALSDEDFFATKVEHHDLCTRTMRDLLNENLIIVEDVYNYEGGVLKIPNIGLRSFIDIRDAFGSRGFDLRR